MIRIVHATYVLKQGQHKYRTEHAIGLRLLAAALRSCGIPIDARETELRYTCTEQGKPYLKGMEGICFSLSHCDGHVVCAVANEPVGVDIEIDRDFNRTMAGKILTPYEMTVLETASETTQKDLFCRYWTLKESWLKMLGTGFFGDPKAVEFGFRDEKVICRNQEVSAVHYAMGKGVHLSVCTRHPDAIRFETCDL